MLETNGQSSHDEMNYPQQIDESEKGCRVASLEFENETSVQHLEDNDAYDCGEGSSKSSPTADSALSGHLFGDSSCDSSDGACESDHEDSDRVDVLENHNITIASLTRRLERLEALFFEQQPKVDDSVCSDDSSIYDPANIDFQSMFNYGHSGDTRDYQYGDHEWYDEDDSGMQMDGDDTTMK
eukprot:gene44858-54867_t